MASVLSTYRLQLRGDRFTLDDATELLDYLDDLGVSHLYLSPVLTAVLMPEGHSADAFRRVVLDKFNMSLGSGLSKVADKVFRIGHLGNINELTLLGTLAGCEMGLALSGVPHQRGGVDVAMSYLSETA